MTFRSSGDLGDCLYLLPVIRAIPGKHTIRCVDRPGITGPFTPRIPIIKPLIEAQSYIEKVECSEKPVDVDLVYFRHFHRSTATLVQAQCSEYNSLNPEEQVQTNGDAPWLDVEPNKEFKGRIIIARSPRYNNQWFPWRKIVEHYGKRLLFVGLDQEYKSFTFINGNVERLEVKDFLELAQAIKGSELFIGNQSSPQAVAMGLGVNIIQEVCLEQPDCIFNRINVQYAANGACKLPDISGSGELELSVAYKQQDTGNRIVVPPGRWQYPGLPASPHFKVQMNLVAKKEQCTLDEADRLLYRHNVERVPEFFKNQGNDPFAFFDQAMKNAFNTNNP